MSWEKMRFRIKNGAVRKLMAPIRANQNARVKKDFKMDLINFIYMNIWKKIKKLKKKLIWKNLKQKLKSCQVKVDQYKSNPPDLQKL